MYTGAPWRGRVWSPEATLAVLFVLVTYTASFPGDAASNDSNPVTNYEHILPAYNKISAKPGYSQVQHPSYATRQLLQSSITVLVYNNTKVAKDLRAAGFTMSSSTGITYKYFAQQPDFDAESSKASKAWMLHPTFPSSLPHCGMANMMPCNQCFSPYRQQSHTCKS